MPEETKRANKRALASELAQERLIIDTRDKMAVGGALIDATRDTDDELAFIEEAEAADAAARNTQASAKKSKKTLKNTATASAFQVSIHIHALTI